MSEKIWQCIRITDGIGVEDGQYSGRWPAMAADDDKWR
jgi:hypothetical protein